MAWKGVFVGYAFYSPAWLVYNSFTRKVLRSRNVTFDETWKGSALPPQQVQDEDNEENEDKDTITPYPPLPPPPIVPHMPTVPTRVEQLQLERVVRIAESPRA